MQTGHRVVILGGGFGGLYAAKALKKAPVQVTVLDRRNFHLFQPLLYQVATGALSPGEIASPLRSVLRRQKNTRVLLGEAVDLDIDNKSLILDDGQTVEYDSLIVATGSTDSYFGHDDWRRNAPSLKTIEEATDIRGRDPFCFRGCRARARPGEAARVADVRDCRRRSHRRGVGRRAGRDCARYAAARLSFHSPGRARAFS